MRISPVVLCAWLQRTWLNAPYSRATLTGIAVVLHRVAVNPYNYWEYRVDGSITCPLRKPLHLELYQRRARRKDQSRAHGFTNPSIGGRAPVVIRYAA